MLGEIQTFFIVYFKFQVFRGKVGLPGIICSKKTQQDFLGHQVSGVISLNQIAKRLPSLSGVPPFQVHSGATGDPYIYPP